MTSRPHIEWISNSAFRQTIEGETVTFDYTYVDRSEDWSKVRSPGRARRRLKQGKPQRIRKVVTPRPGLLRGRGCTVAHPAYMADVADTLRRERQQHERDTEAARAAGIDPDEAQRVINLWRKNRSDALSQMHNGRAWQMPDIPQMEAPLCFGDPVPVQQSYKVYTFQVIDNRVMCGKLCVEDFRA